MLTDWERHQLAEIERGLNEDFTLRHRTRRLLGMIKPWAVLSVLLFLGCLVILMAVGAWQVAIALAAIYAMVIFGGSRGDRRRRARARRYPRR